MIILFEHPWQSGLFGDDEMAQVWSPEQQLKHMLRFEAQYTRALGYVGQVDADEAEVVARQIEAFTPDMEGLKAGTARDGLVVPALVKQLKDAVSGSAEAVHKGATSQDVLDTALVLTLRDCNDLLSSRLAQLVTALEALDSRFGENALMGRTRMQAALPIRVSDRVRIWMTPLAENAARLDQLRPRLERVQLGGPVGDRQTFGADGDAIAKHLAEALGLTASGPAWHTDRGTLAEYAGLLSLITGALGKVGQDMCLMTQQGIDEIALESGGGSSAMAHKQNPILPELLVTLAAFNATQLSGMHHALVHEQERSGAAWALEWMLLPQMALATGRSLQAAAQACRNILRLGS